MEKESAVRQEEAGRKGLMGIIRRVLPPAPPPDIFDSKVHTKAELADINGLVAQAHKQIEIAQLDHDARLRRSLGELAQRSCLNPGSVTQSELDNLPRPSRKEFLLGERPYALGGDCYVHAYQYLGTGAANAEELRRMSTPTQTPADTHIQTPVDARPRLSPAPAYPTPPPPLSTILPKLKEFAIAACRAPEQVSIDPYLYKNYDLSYRQYDDNLAESLATGLDDCPRQLFNQLIANFRAHDFRAADRQWIRTLVAAYTRTSSGTIPPGAGDRGRSCEDFGNVRCP